MKISLVGWLNANKATLQCAVKAVASSLKNRSDCVKKESVVSIQESGKASLSLKKVSITERQTFTSMITAEQLLEWLLELPGRFKQLDLFTQEGWSYHFSFHDTEGMEVSIKRSKMEKPLDILAHNRIKKFAIAEQVPFAPFIAAGIMDTQGKVIHSMRHKFNQVNSFIALMEESIDRFMVEHLPQEKLHLLDFGCGKGYLTVAIAHYFSSRYPSRIHVIGIDSRSDVITRCREMYRDVPHLSFIERAIGDINHGFLSDVGISHVGVIALHACNTASDVALYKAHELNAQLFFVAPCCHAEIARSLDSEYSKFVTAHPILKQKLSALLTDAYRAALMETVGWSVSVIEFVDPEHTPKNTLLKGMYTGIKKPLNESALFFQSHLASPQLLQRLLEGIEKKSYEREEATRKGSIKTVPK